MRNHNASACVDAMREVREEIWQIDGKVRIQELAPGIQPEPLPDEILIKYIERCHEQVFACPHTTSALVSAIVEHFEISRGAARAWLIGQQAKHLQSW